MVELIEDALACHRLTRLLVRDTILDRTRERVRDALPPVLVKLSSCHWCLSVWVGFGVVLARRACPRAWAPIASALACSAVAGLAADLG